MTGTKKTTTDIFERRAGIATLAALILGILVVNSPLSEWYNTIHHLPIHIGVGEQMYEEPLIYWVNEGLMVLFFLHIGLEIKTNVLSAPNARRELLLPTLCALGGVIIPAAIYLTINYQFDTISGWAVPTATDIVLVMAVVSLLGDRVPISLRAFLLLLAVFDDIIAILIIALFFGSEVESIYAVLTSVCVIVLLVMNKLRIKNVGLHILVGLVLWQAMQHTGINPTLTGVILSLTFPNDNQSKSSTDELKPWVYFFIVPLFAFFNAGVNLLDINVNTFEPRVMLGIFLGLVIGKVVGIVMVAGIATITGLCKLPDQMRWSHLIGCGFLAGIGFTMSLFISSLAFDNKVHLESARAAILMASIAAALIGICILRLSSNAQAAPKLRLTHPY